MQNSAIWCVMLVILTGCHGLESGTTCAPQGMTPAAEKGISLDLGDGVRLELVPIPAGEFLMGSPDSDRASPQEKPQHPVRITKPFYLGVSPVTLEQWAAVMGSGRISGHAKGLQNPAGGVSWDDVQQFLEVLSGKSDAGGGRYRLPTEAEWEYSCRAGSEARYCYGDDKARLGKYAWYEATSKVKTRPVGLKKPNAWGLYDMHGNVSEWCSDWYDGRYYEKSPIDDPKGPGVGSQRVARGGWFYSPAFLLRCASRDAIGSSYRHDGSGFRVVCER